MKAVVVLVATSIVTTPAVAQRWQRQVEERAQRAVQAIEPAKPLNVVKRSGMLNLNESVSFETTLRQGQRYAIVAVCDDDCSRLELTLLTPSRSEIAKEANSESLPTLHFTPSTTMSYGIRVVMGGCRWNPCWYAVAVVPLGENPL